MQEISEEVRNVIKKSEKLFRTNEKEITSRMYEILFERYPDTKMLFKEFRTEQPRLFSAALMFHIVTIDYPQDVLLSFRVGTCRSHVKAGVQAEHYPLMKECLLQAMREILQNEATDEFMGAWEKWYDFIASLLIDREAKHYSNERLLFPEGG